MNSRIPFNMASSQSCQTLYVCRVSQNEDEHSFSGKLYTEKIENMRKNLGSELKLDTSVISIKAKTNEGMGFIGAGEGIAAFSVVMLQADK